MTPALLRTGALALALLAASTRAAPCPDALRPGDLLYLSLRTRVGRAIEATTGSPVSHLGIVDRGPDGSLVVLHAAGTVRRDPLPAFLAYGRGHVEANRWAFPDAAAREAFLAAARALLGRPYDSDYSLEPDAIYCSELVWQALRQGLGVEPVSPEPMDFDAGGPEVRAFWERWFRGDVPQGRSGISPEHYRAAPGFRPVCGPEAP